MAKTLRFVNKACVCCATRGFFLLYFLGKIKNALPC